MRTATPARSNAPSIEYRNHYSVEAPEISRREFRQAWRVHDRLNTFLRREMISPEAYLAGAQWRRWVEQTGHMRVQSWNVRVDHARTSTTPSAGLLAAARSLQAANEALGPRKVKLLTLALVDARTWREIGARLGIQGAPPSAVPSGHSKSWRAGGAAKGDPAN
jgi:hypothetical protein